MCFKKVDRLDASEIALGYIIFIKARLYNQ
jgi:hypothetical protein